MSTPHARDSSLVRGLLYLVITSFGWGLNWPAMKFLLGEFPPLFSRGTAGVLAGAGLLGIAMLQGGALSVRRGERSRLVLAAFLNVFAWMGFSTLSMKWLSVSEAALLVYTMPIWATLLAWPINGQRPRALPIAGLLMSVAGLFLLFGGASLNLNGAKWGAMLFALAAAALFALGTIGLRAFTGISPTAVLAWQLLLGCAPMVLLSLVFEDIQPERVTMAGWLLMLYMTIMPMGICYLTWFAALRRLPPVLASTGTLLTPVIGVCAASVALHEPLGVREVTSLVLTLGGVGLAIVGRPR